MNSEVNSSAQSDATKQKVSGKGISNKILLSVIALLVVLVVVLAASLAYPYINDDSVSVKAPRTTAPKVEKLESELKDCKNEQLAIIAEAKCDPSKMMIMAGYVGNEEGSKRKYFVEVSYPEIFSPFPVDNTTTNPNISGSPVYVSLNLKTDLVTGKNRDMEAYGKEIFTITTGYALNSFTESPERKEYSRIKLADGTEHVIYKVPSGDGGPGFSAMTDIYYIQLEDDLVAEVYSNKFIDTVNSVETSTKQSDIDLALKIFETIKYSPVFQ